MCYYVISNYEAHLIKLLVLIIITYIYIYIYLQISMLRGCKSSNINIESKKTFCKWNYKSNYIN